jgi:hypothetical protein
MWYKVGIQATPLLIFTNKMLNVNELLEFPHPNVSLHPPLYTKEVKQELG